MSVTRTPSEEKSTLHLGACVVHNFQSATGITSRSCWGQPCYTLLGKCACQWEVKRRNANRAVLRTEIALESTALCAGAMRLLANSRRATDCKPLRSSHPYNIVVLHARGYESKEGPFWHEGHLLLLTAGSTSVRVNRICRVGVTPVILE
eukprot:2497082-Amphidinium_carterae.1